MPAILITVGNKQDLLSHKTYRLQIHTGKTVQTVLLSEILFILFTLHLFTKWPASEITNSRLDYAM